MPIIALILVAQKNGVGTLARSVSERSPVKGLAGFMFASAGFLLLMWLGKIVPALTWRRHCRYGGLLLRSSMVGQVRVVWIRAVNGKQASEQAKGSQEVDD